MIVHDAEQRLAAEASRERVQGRLARPAVTQVEDARWFGRPGDDHQRYLERRGLANCHVSLAS